MVRKSNDALSEGVSVSKSNNDDEIVVVVGGGGGKVGHVLGLLVVLSTDFNSSSSTSSSYFGNFTKKKLVTKVINISIYHIAIEIFSYGKRLIDYSIVMYKSDSSL